MEQENIDKSTVEEKDKQMEISGNEVSNEQSGSNQETSGENEKRDPNAMDTNAGMDNSEKGQDSNEEKMKIVDGKC